jgi:hypothetical protein
MASWQPPGEPYVGEADLGEVAHECDEAIGCGDVSRTFRAKERAQQLSARGSRAAYDRLAGRLRGLRQYIAGAGMARPPQSMLDAAARGPGRQYEPPARCTRRCLLLGTPASGKQTLLTRLASGAAAQWEVATAWSAWELGSAGMLGLRWEDLLAGQNADAVVLLLDGSQAGAAAQQLLQQVTSALVAVAARGAAPVPLLVLASMQDRGAAGCHSPAELATLLGLPPSCLLPAAPCKHVWGGQAAAGSVGVGGVGWLQPDPTGAVDHAEDGLREVGAWLFAALGSPRPWRARQAEEATAEEVAPEIPSARSFASRVVFSEGGTVDMDDVIEEGEESDEDDEIEPSFLSAEEKERFTSALRASAERGSAITGDSDWDEIEIAVALVRASIAAP